MHFEKDVILAVRTLLKRSKKIKPISYFEVLWKNILSIKFYKIFILDRGIK